MKGTIELHVRDEHGVLVHRSSHPVEDVAAVKAEIESRGADLTHEPENVDINFVEEPGPPAAPAPPTTEGAPETAPPGVAC